MIRAVSAILSREVQNVGQGIRFSCLIVTLSLVFSTAAQDPPKPQVSKDPLTAEQIAVYRAVLQDYTNGSRSPLNVANRTEPLEKSELFSDKSCVKGLEFESPDNAVAVVHQIDPVAAPSKKFVLVDPDIQQKKIEENDPQKLMKRAIDDREKVSKRQVDDSVTQAFATGLFTLSEIVFDKQHGRAVLSYSFVCGGLCGHGNTLILKKVGKEWRVSRRCGGWIS
jgi:hypothetical protein